MSPCSTYMNLFLVDLPAQDGNDHHVGDEPRDADDELQDDLQPEVDDGVRLLHVLKRVDGSAAVGSGHSSVC